MILTGVSVYMVGILWKRKPKRATDWIGKLHVPSCGHSLLVCCYQRASFVCTLLVFWKWALVSWFGHSRPHIQHVCLFVWIAFVENPQSESLAWRSWAWCVPRETRRMTNAVTRATTVYSYLWGVRNDNEDIYLDDRFSLMLLVCVLIASRGSLCSAQACVSQNPPVLESRTFWRHCFFQVIDRCKLCKVLKRRRLWIILFKHKRKLY